MLESASVRGLLQGFTYLLGCTSDMTQNKDLKLQVHPFKRCCTTAVERKQG